MSELEKIIAKILKYDRKRERQTDRERNLESEKVLKQGAL